MIFKKNLFNNYIAIFIFGWSIQLYCYWFLPSKKSDNYVKDEFDIIIKKEKILKEFAKELEKKFNIKVLSVDMPCAGNI